MENNLPKAEFDSLKFLIRNKELIVQKADKSSTLVLLNRKNYNSKMKLILADTSKFKNIQIDDSKVLNQLIPMENKMLNFSKDLKKSKKYLIKSTMYYTLQVKPGILYGLCKICKSVVDGLHPFRPILTAIGTHIYKLAKFVVPLLEPLTYNQYTIKDLFLFCEELKHFNRNLIMTILDVESLFTNITLQETIDFVFKSYLRITVMLMVCPGTLFV